MQHKCQGLVPLLIEQPILANYTLNQKFRFNRILIMTQQTIYSLKLFVKMKTSFIVSRNLFLAYHIVIAF